MMNHIQTQDPRVISVDGEKAFEFLDPLSEALERRSREPEARPYVTLSYAQSLDGSISLDGASSCCLSSSRSLRLTHFLRSRHDALLVGINTILADDPQLTVRHWNGPDPRPVVLDRSLRCPLDARFLGQPSRHPILITAPGCSTEHRIRLAERGAEILTCSLDRRGFLDLAEVLRLLGDQGLRSVMVEGGGSVITHFLRDEFVDYCVITVAPRFIGGFKAVNELCREPDQIPLGIAGCQYREMDGDLIAYGPMEQTA